MQTTGSPQGNIDRIVPKFVSVFSRIIHSHFVVTTNCDPSLFTAPKSKTRYLNTKTKHIAASVHRRDVGDTSDDGRGQQTKDFMRPEPLRAPTPLQFVLKGSEVKRFTTNCYNWVLWFRIVSRIWQVDHCQFLNSRFRRTCLLTLRLKIPPRCYMGTDILPVKHQTDR